MWFLAPMLSFLPSGFARVLGAVAEAVADVLGEIFKTRAGWGVAGAAIGAGLMWLHVTGQWHADIAARTARANNAQAIETQRQANITAITVEMARLRSEALATAERALDEKVKETPHEAAGDDRPGLSADRVRRIFSVR